LSYVRVPGERRDHRVLMFTTSGCTPCRKAKSFFEGRGIEYEYLELDTADQETRREAMLTIGDYIPSWGTQFIFPIIIIDELISLIGYSERKLAKVFDTVE